MPAGLQWIAEHQPVTPIADTLRALMLGHAGRQRGDRRARLVRRAGIVIGRARRRVPVPAALIGPCGGPTLRRCSASTPPPSAGSRSATSGSTGRSRARKPTAQDLLETVQGAALPAARPDGGRRPQPPARALQPPRRVRRDAASSELAYERARAVRVLGARGVATCSARTCRSTATRCAAPSGGAWRAQAERVVGERARVPRAHPRAPRATTGRCARATSRTARRSAGSVHDGGWTQPAATSPGCST